MVLFAHICVKKMNIYACFRTYMWYTKHIYVFFGITYMWVYHTYICWFLLIYVVPYMLVFGRYMLHVYVGFRHIYVQFIRYMWKRYMFILEHICGKLAHIYARWGTYMWLSIYAPNGPYWCEETIVQSFTPCSSD